MALSKIAGVLKYQAARFVEKNPLLSNAIYNNISHFKFLFPHEKDYHGIKHFCESSDEKCFVDIGANIGLSTIGFRKLGYQNKMLMFEANPYLADFLRNLQEKDPMARTFQVALGNENTEKEIYLAYYGGTCLHTFSSFDRKFIDDSLRKTYPEKYKEVEIVSHKVAMRKFDDVVIDQPPSFVKIDVEGFEAEILKGMKNTISKYRPVLLIEFNQQKFNEIWVLLKDEYDVYSYDFSEDSIEALNIASAGELSGLDKLSSVRNLFWVPKKHEN